VDEEQVRLFLAEARRCSACYPLYLAAILTGMRQGELLGLRWRGVNLAHRSANAVPAWRAAVMAAPENRDFPADYRPAPWTGGGIEEDPDGSDRV
jgi:integrase